MIILNIVLLYTCCQKPSSWTVFISPLTFHFLGNLFIEQMPMITDQACGAVLISDGLGLIIDLIGYLK